MYCYISRTINKLQNFIDRTDQEKSIKTTPLIITRDVTKTGNGEWGMGNGEWEMGNGKLKMGN